MWAKEIGGSLNDHGNGDHGPTAKAGLGILAELLGSLESDGDDLLRREVERHEINGVRRHARDSLHVIVVLVVLLNIFRNEGKQCVKNGFNKLVTLNSLFLAN